MNKENFKDYILNEKNNLITEEVINKILKKYNIKYKIKNLSNFIKSLTHVSYIERDNINEKLEKSIKDVKPIEPELRHSVVNLQFEDYERLEFLGDSIIKQVLSEYLFKRYDESKVGFLTETRTKLENSEMLSFLSKKLNLNKYILIARNIENDNGRNSNKITEDVFESFIAALYLDSGFEITKNFIINIIEKEIDMSLLISKNNNYKSLLIQYFHKMKWNDPKYIEEKNLKTNKNSFIIYIKIQDKLLSKGIGSTKIKAEQNAAYNALKNLDYFKDNEEEYYYGEL